MHPPKNYVCIERGQHFWIFVFDDASRIACLDALSRYAANPEMPFEWADAAEASRQIHELTKAKPAPMEPSRFNLFPQAETRRAITTQEFEAEARRAIDYAQAMHCLVKIDSPIGSFYVRKETQLTHLMLGNYPFDSSRLNK